MRTIGRRAYIIFIYNRMRLIREKDLILHDLRSGLNVPNLRRPVILYKYICVCVYLFSSFPTERDLSLGLQYRREPGVPIISVPQRPAVEMVHQSMKRNRDLIYWRSRVSR